MNTIFQQQQALQTFFSQCYATLQLFVQLLLGGEKNLFGTWYFLANI